MSSSVLKRDRSASLPQMAWRSWPGGAAAAPGQAQAASALRAAPDAARLEKEAYERGFREGEASGARKSGEQFQAAIRAFADSVATLADHKAALCKQAERELAELALAVARRVVCRELALDPGVVLAVVRSCLDELRNAEIYRLRLHPQDVQPVAAYLNEQRRARIEIVPDMEISRGGAVFETSQGRLDARIGTQLEEIERGLADG